MTYQRITIGPLENNCYIMHNKGESIIIDASGRKSGAHKIMNTVKDKNLKVKGIYITHGHFDHIDAAMELSDLTGAGVHLNPKDGFLWDEVYGKSFYTALDDEEKILLGDEEIRPLATPGHTPGSTCYYAKSLKAVFTGDTLFPGGPGAIRWNYSSLNTIIDSIENKLFNLPDDTEVLPGHGPSTTIEREKETLKKLKER